MSSPRSALALTLLLALSPALAGCIGGRESPDELPALSLDDSTNESLNTTAPDGRGDIAAFKETNRTESGTGGMDHKHDYWKGRESVILHQGSYIMVPIPLLPEGAPAGTAIGDFVPDPPNLVYEGTDRVEVLFKDVSIASARRFAPAPVVVPHPYVNLRIWYLTPADPPDGWHDAGLITPEKPLVIPVEPLQADMPHSVASLWVFRAFTDEPNALSFNLTITAVRGQAVVEWPPHPDLYAERATRVVMDEDAKTTEAGSAQWVLYGDNANWHEPEKVVSYGTTRVDVTVKVLGTDSPVPPTGYYLQVHNASTRAPAGGFGAIAHDLEPVKVDGDTLTFSFPVDEYGMDSPYATFSRWGFRLRAAFASCGDCIPYTVDYHITAVAHGQSTG